MTNKRKLLIGSAVVALCAGAFLLWPRSPIHAPTPEKLAAILGYPAHVTLAFEEVTESYGSDPAYLAAYQYSYAESGLTETFVVLVFNAGEFMVGERGELEPITTTDDGRTISRVQYGMAPGARSFAFVIPSRDHRFELVLDVHFAADDDGDPNAVDAQREVATDRPFAKGDLDNFMVRISDEVFPEKGTDLRLSQFGI